MNNKLDIAIVNQMQALYNFSNEELREFYVVLLDIDEEQKNKLLMELDDKLENQKKILGDLINKFKISSNKLDEFMEKKQLKEIDINL